MIHVSKRHHQSIYSYMIDYDLWLITATSSRGCIHEDVISWKCFLHCWFFVRRFHWSQVESHQKGPGMLSFDVFFVVILNQLFSKLFDLPVIWVTMTLMWCNHNVVHMVIYRKTHYTINPSTDAGLYNVVSSDCIILFQWYTTYLEVVCSKESHQRIISYHRIDGLVQERRNSIVNAL